MAQFFGKETVLKMSLTSTTVVTWPAGSALKVGGKGYTSLSPLTLNTALTGAGGLDTGTIAASTLYHIYVFVNFGQLSLKASTSPTTPSGHRKLGKFVTSTTSTIESIENNLDGLENKMAAGHVITMATDIIPEGYIACDGRSLTRTLFSDLFAGISSKHGTASGTTFNIPDYRGRFLRGVDSTASGAGGRDLNKSSRTAAALGGVTGDQVGSVQSAATSTPVNPFSASGGTHSHTITMYQDAGGGGAPNNPIHGASTLAPLAKSTSVDGTHSHTITGGDTETRPINSYVMYCIKY